MNQKDTLKKTTALTLWLRIMVGAFVIYLAYSIGIDLKNTSGKDTIVLGIAVIAFVLAGGVICLHSLYRLIRKDYYDPMCEDSTDASEQTMDSTIEDADSKAEHALAPEENGKPGAQSADTLAESDS